MVLSRLILFRQPDGGCLDQGVHAVANVFAVIAIGFGAAVLSGIGIGAVGFGTFAVVASGRSSILRVILDDIHPRAFDMEALPDFLEKGLLPRPTQLGFLIDGSMAQVSDGRADGRRTPLASSDVRKHRIDSVVCQILGRNRKVSANVILIGTMLASKSGIIGHTVSTTASRSSTTVALLKLANFHLAHH